MEGAPGEKMGRRQGMDRKNARPVHTAGARPFSVADYGARIQSPRPSAMRMGRRQDKTNCPMMHRLLV